MRDVLNLQMLYFLLAWPIRQLTFLFRTIESTRPILISSIVAALIEHLARLPRGSQVWRARNRDGRTSPARSAICVYLAIAWMRVSSTHNRKILGNAAEMKL